MRTRRLANAHFPQPIHHQRQAAARRAHRTRRDQHLRRQQRRLGGETLGLQGPTNYVQVTNHDAYLLRDSHAHFYGGVYLGIAIFLIVAGTNLRKYRSALNVVFAVIFAGGVARLTKLEPGVTFGNDLAASSLIELIGMPAMALWLATATRTPRRADATTRVVAAHA